MTFSRTLLITTACCTLLAHMAAAQTITPTAPQAAAPAAVAPQANTPIIVPAAAPAAAPAANPTTVVVAPVAAVPVPAKPVAPVAAAPAHNANVVTKDELPALIKKALMENPEMLVEVAQKYRDEQEKNSEKRMREGIAKNKDALFNDADSPSIGDPKADVTIVEFFDYHCGYCHQLLPAIVKLASEDKKVRIVFKEFPILSEDSVDAAKAALAVNRIAKDKYFAFHQELMKGTGRFDEKSLLEIAKKLGVNGEKLKAEMAKPELVAELDKTRAVADDMGLRGTPAIIINDQVFPGALSYDELKKEVDKARAVASTSPAKN
ncbi:MAG: DsbA family protein [Rickettsiales bacterium]|nr:DsbA family protein [Rickettsiales bacterium]